MKDVLTTVTSELGLMVVFLLGFVLFNTALAKQLLLRAFPQTPKIKKGAGALLRKQLQADVASGQWQDAVKAFRAHAEAAVGPVPADEAQEEAECVALCAKAVVELANWLQDDGQHAAAEVALLLEKAFARGEPFGSLVRGRMLSELYTYPAVLARLLAYLRGTAHHPRTLEKGTGHLVLQCLAEAGNRAATEALLADVGSGLSPFLAAGVYRTLGDALLAKADVAGAAACIEALHAKQEYIPAHLTTSLVRAALEQADAALAIDLLERLPCGGEALSAVLTALAQEPERRELERVVSLASEKGLPMLYTSYEKLVQAFAKLGDARAGMYFDAMCSSACALPPTEATCALVLQSCRRCDDLVLKVLQFLRKDGRAGPYYQPALAAVEPSAGSRILGLMRQDGLPTPEPCRFKGSRQELSGFMSQVRACALQKDSAKAVALLATVEPDTIAYNAVLDCCAKAGDLAQAEALFKAMRTEGKVDAASFNTLLQLPLLPEDPVERIRELFAAMDASKVKRNVVTFNSAVFAALRSNNFDAAWAFVEQMEAEMLRPDAATCTSLLRHALKVEGKALERSLALLEKCCSPAGTRGLAPLVMDAALLQTLVDACVRLREPMRLGTAVRALRKQGVPAGGYLSLFRAYAQPMRQAAPHKDRFEPASARRDLAKSAWREMHERGITPNDQTCQAYVDCLCACDDAQGAFAALAEQRSPAVIVALIRGCAQLNDRAKARELYAELRGLGGTVTLVLYNALLDAVARLGDVDLAAEVFRDMCAQGVVPDLVTYSSVIKGYCVQGELEQAIQLFTLMRKRGIQPDEVLFNSLLDGCAKKAQVPLAEMVLGDMRGCGARVSNYTLSILVKLYSRARMVDKALACVEELPREHGFTANTQVRTCLMQACLNTGRFGQAWHMFENIPRPDSKAFASIIRGCVKAKKLQEGVKAAVRAAELRQWVDCADLVRLCDAKGVAVPACLR